MQFLPLSAMLTPSPSPLPPLTPLPNSISHAHQPLHPPSSVIRSLSIILSPFIFATIQRGCRYTPAWRKMEGRVRRGKTRGGEKNQLRGRNEQGATSGKKKKTPGMDLRGMRSGASGNDEREEGGSHPIFLCPC